MRKKNETRARGSWKMKRGENVLELVLYIYFTPEGNVREDENGFCVLSFIQLSFLFVHPSIPNSHQDQVRGRKYIYFGWGMDMYHLSVAQTLPAFDHRLGHIPLFLLIFLFFLPFQISLSCAENIARREQKERNEDARASWRQSTTVEQQK